MKSFSNYTEAMLHYLRMLSEAGREKLMERLHDECGGGEVLQYVDHLLQNIKDT